MHKSYRLAVMFSALFATSGLVAPSFAQTLEETLIAAYERHPALDAARASVRSADEGVAQARGGTRPFVTGQLDLGASTGDGFFDVEGSNNQSAQIGLQQRIYDSGATPARIETARAAVESARALLQNTEQTVLLEAITAYSDVLRDIQFLSLARNNVRVIERELQAAKDRFQVGEVTRTDVAQAEARLAAAQSNLIASEGGLQRSRDAFIAAIGTEPKDLAPPPALPEVPANESVAQELARQNHPQIRAASEAVILTEFALENAKSAFGPTVDINGSLSSSRSEGQNNFGSGTTITDTNRLSLGLQMRLPIYSGGSNVSAMRQAQADLEEAQANLQDTARIVRQNVSAAMTGLAVARSSIAASRLEITATRIAFESVQEEALLGARTTLAVLDAEQDLLNAQTNLVSAERDEFVAIFTLLSAIGLLSVDQLGLDVDIYDPEDNFDAVQRAPFLDERTGGPFGRILGRF